MSRFVREALAFAVNPIQGFNRIVRGEAWRVRSSHNLYHDYQSVPVRFTLGVGTRYLADDGALFRGEMAPCLELGMEYGDAYNERTNRPYDYFTAHLDIGLTSNQPTMSGAHLLGRLWAAPVYVGRSVEARFGIFQHFNYFDSKEVKDGSGTVPYRISEAVGMIDKAFVKQVREDGKIDLVLQKGGMRKVEDFADTLLEYLSGHGGFAPFTDKTEAGQIYDTFGVSKKTFKKAVGDLYKKHLVTLGTDGLRLV